MSYLWMVGLVMRLFSCGSTFEDHQHVFSQKRSSPLELIFDTCASASLSHLCCLVKLNICGCSLLLGQIYFQQKICILHFGRALIQNTWICPIMSYLWINGLMMRFFSYWTNLWRLSTCIQPKKVQSLGIYFWYLCLGLFKSPCSVGEAEHMWLQPFARTNIFSAIKMYFPFWACVDTKCLNLSHHVLSMDGWPGDAIFFLLGHSLKIINMYSVKKGPAFWNLFLTPASRPLQVTLFGWWSWTYVVAAFC